MATSLSFLLDFPPSLWQVEALPLFVKGAISTTVNQRDCLYFFCFMAIVLVLQYRTRLAIHETNGNTLQDPLRMYIPFNYPFLMNVFVAK